MVTCMVFSSILLFSEKAESADVESGQSWEAPQPDPDGYDWVQLTSKEWLKGNLEGLYGNKLEFDSDKLEYLEFEWEDVTKVLGNHIFDVRFDGEITGSGYLTVTEEQVIISNGDKKQEFDRDKLITITPGYSKRIDLWKTRIGFGLNISKGNTDQIQYNMKANFKRRTVKTEFELQYLGNYASTDNEITSNSQRVSSYFDILKTRDYFFRLVQAEYFRDPFQNIRYRSTVGAAMGVDLIETFKTNWNVKAGPAYQRTGFNSVGEGEDQTASTFALAAGTYLDTKLTGKLDFIAQYNFYIVDKKSGRYTHHALAALETELTEMLDFDVTGLWDRTQNPAPKSDGRIPEKDDFKLIFSVSMDF